MAYVAIHAHRCAHLLAFRFRFVSQRLSLGTIVFQVDGSYLLDDQPIHAQEFKRMSGYVMQVGILNSHAIGAVAHCAVGVTSYWNASSPLHHPFQAKKVVVGACLLLRGHAMPEAAIDADRRHHGYGGNTSLLRCRQRRNSEGVPTVLHTIFLLIVPWCERRSCEDRKLLSVLMRLQCWCTRLGVARRSSIMEDVTMFDLPSDVTNFAVVFFLLRTTLCTPC